MIRILLCLLLISSALAVEKSPPSRYGYELGVDFRMLKKKRRFIFLAESKNRKEITDNNYNQVMLGTYYRLTKRFRIGAFAQFEQGLRWDEDWRRGPVKWEWQKTNARWDYSTALDATYTDKLFKNMLWEMKGRAFYYHSREALQLRLRPGLRYFVMKEGKPLWQIFGEVEGYIPVTYGSRSLYEYWLYLGTLYQVTPKLAVGPVISYRERRFHAYDKFESRARESFKTHYQSTYIGLNVLYNF